MALGPDDAKVTIVEYAAPTCPHCAAFNKDVFPKLKSEFIDTGKVTLPVSMNSDLSFGNTSLLNAAQCGQVGAAYSTIVTLASSGPSAMSGSACGLVTSLAGTANALETSGV